MDEVDKAYLAGYFDADGCVSVRIIQPSSPSVNIRVGVEGRDKALLEELEFVYGGVLYQRKDKCGPPAIAWSWTLNGRGAIPFLEDVLPYLRLKNRQAELALEIARFLRLGGRGVSSWERTRRARLALEICELNQNNLSNPKVTKTIQKLQELIKKGEGQHESIFRE